MTKPVTDFNDGNIRLLMDHMRKQDDQQGTLLIKVAHRMEQFESRLERMSEVIKRIIPFDSIEKCIQISEEKTAKITSMTHVI